MFEMRYRIMGKSAGVIIEDSKTESPRTMNTLVRDMLEMGDFYDEIIVFEDGRPYSMKDAPTGLGQDADSIISDWFSFEAATRHPDGDPNSGYDCHGYDHPGYRP